MGWREDKGNDRGVDKRIVTYGLLAQAITPVAGEVNAPLCTVIYSF
jgi:hypothetical protein